MERVYFKSTQCQNGNKNEFLHVCTRQQVSIYNGVMLDSHRLDWSKPLFSDSTALNARAQI